MDIKTVYFYGVITEDIFMVQSEGYEVKDRNEYVYKLNKGIYGLK